jgi:hypothetical protein
VIVSSDQQRSSHPPKKEGIMTMDALEVAIPEFASVVCRIDIERNCVEAWESIGGFADAGRFLDVASKLVLGGTGKIGTVRQVGDRILEVMVGCSDFSYTYAQVVGPMAQFAYHGCVTLSALPPRLCTLTYTIVYDERQMDSEQRGILKARITKRFQGAVEAMKHRAEQPPSD